MKKSRLALLAIHFSLFILVCFIAIRSYCVAEFWQYRLIFAGGYHGAKKIDLSRGWLGVGLFPAQETVNPDEIVSSFGGPPRKVTSREWFHKTSGSYPVSQVPLTLSRYRIVLPGFQFWNVVGVGMEIRFVVWYLLVLLLIYPAAVMYMTLKKRRLLREHHCAVCGYSLTGNTSGICPECGEAR